jgi:hypothetical protein
MFMVLHIIAANRIQNGSTYIYLLRLYVNYCLSTPLVQIILILYDILGVLIVNMNSNTMNTSLFNDSFVAYRLPLDLILIVAYCIMDSTIVIPSVFALNNHAVSVICGQ